MTRHLTLLLSLSLLTACENSVDPWVGQIDTKDCQRITLSPTAGVLTVPPDQQRDLCVRVPAGDRTYLLAYVDTRLIEASRTGPEMPLPRVREIFHMSLRGAKRDLKPRTSTLPGEKSSESQPDIRLESAMTECPPGPNYFCRENPWKVGDKVVAPNGVAAIVGIIAGPLVLAFPEATYNTMSDALKADHASVAAAIVRTQLPLLASAFTGVPVTSVGSQQTLVLMGLTGAAGLASAIADGATIRGYIHCAFSAASVDPGTMFFVMAHELTHLAQMKWTWELDPARRVALTAQGRGYFGATYWSGEGVADFLASEGLRLESGTEWGNNMSTTGIPTRSIFGHYAITLRDGDGDIESGYASAARYMKSLAELAVNAGIPVGTAVREVARGAVEGWFGIDDAKFKSVGLSERMSKAGQPGFDPATSLLTFTMRNALDDLDPKSQWNITSLLDAWRSYPPHYSAAASADTAAIDIGASEGGTGYIKLRADAQERVIRISVPFAGMRWMTGSF